MMFGSNNQSAALKLRAAALILALMLACAAITACESNNTGDDTFAAETSDITTAGQTEEETMPVTLELPGIDDFYGDVNTVTLREDKHMVRYYCLGAVTFDLTITVHDHMPTADEEGETVVELKNTEERTYNLEKMTDGHTYRIKVRAYDGNGGCSPEAVAYISCDRHILNPGEVERAAAEFGIKEGTSAYLAMLDIDRVYYDTVAAKATNEIIIFFFEGTGEDWAKRYSALVVVVKDGKVLFANNCCSTIPDYPFDPSKNNGKDMGTVADGFYVFTTKNHNGEYASLNINNPLLVRFKDQTHYYRTTEGSAFDIHRRYSDGIAPADAGWVNSAGCFLVNTAGPEPFIPFAKAVGIIPANATKLTTYTKSVKGHVVVDRYYAEEFMLSLGYPQSAIDQIRQRSAALRIGK